MPAAENSFKCLFCNRLSTNSWGHEKHLKEIHGINYARYKCIVCKVEPRFFVHFQEFLKHWHTHKCSKENPWTCMDCGKNFISYKGYMQHLGIKSEEKQKCVPSLRYTSHCKKLAGTGTAKASRPRPYLKRRNPKLGRRNNFNNAQGSNISIIGKATEKFSVRIENFVSVY